MWPRRFRCSGAALNDPPADRGGLVAASEELLTRPEWSSTQRMAAGLDCGFESKTQRVPN
jgi:hypothetical protein